MYKLMALCLLGLITISTTAMEWPPKTWTQPEEPFHMVGPIYYVGGAELTAYLLVDEQGMILVNVGMAENVPMVLASIRKLGFDPAELKYLLITQAHMDHAGGAALIQKKTGVLVMAGEADLSLLRSGGLKDYVFGDELPFEPVEKVKGLKDNDIIELGKLKLKTLAIPGHTPGSCGWLLETKQGKVFLQGSISLLDDAELHNNAIYPHAITDFQKTLARLQNLKPDFILPDHMVFAHPKGMGHQDKPALEWFKRLEILENQLKRTGKKLHKHLKM